MNLTIWVLMSCSFISLFSDSISKYILFIVLDKTSWKDQLGFLIITEDKSVVFKITNEHFLNPFADCSILT